MLAGLFCTPVNEGDHDLGLERRRRQTDRDAGFAARSGPGGDFDDQIA